MSDPIMFVSHFRIKEGSLEDLRTLTRDATERLRQEKPRTLFFGAYLDEDEKIIHFVHAFADAESMDVHFEGSDERAQASYQFIEPMGWEFYGSPSASALESMQKTATAAGVPLHVEPEFVSGFVRL